MTADPNASALKASVLPTPDGRALRLYGPYGGAPRWTFGEGDHGSAHSHMRYHPLRREWVVYSAHRQSRTYKPSSDCPFCPHSPDGEIPVDDFSIAVLDNRFSAFQQNPSGPPHLSGIRTGEALGACEVIVYSADHAASMASLSAERRQLLVRVWGARIEELLARPGIRFVMPFENRGEEAGVTLHHPHGQIYAFSYLPPVVENMVAGFREGATLTAGEEYHIAGAPTAAAFVPPYARFPYEVWIAPNAFRPTPTALDAEEVRDLAQLLGEVAARYDAFFGRACPYVMIVYASPCGAEAFFPFHIQFYPLLRSPQKLKFIAGVEQGAGTFLVDVLPEDAARSLRLARL